MLGAIEQKIKDMKRSKCEQKNYSNTRNNINDCYSNDLSNTYLPTQEELYVETIYLNRGSVKIGTLKDEIEYTITKGIRTDSSTILPYSQANQTDNSIGLNFSIEGTDPFRDIRQEFQDKINTIRKNPTQQNVDIGLLFIKTWRERISKIVDENLALIRLQHKGITDAFEEEVNYYNNELNSVAYSYTLRYKKDSYTLEEAKTELEKKDVSNEEFLVTSDDQI